MSFKEIVLVEDDDDHAALIQLALASHVPPCIVRHIDDGEKAIKAVEDLLIAEPRSMPLLFLLDVNLPGISGIEVLRRIKAEPTLRAIPVLMLTSSRADIDITNSYNAYANSYIVKPTSFPEIESRMHLIKKYWLEANVMKSA